MTEKEDVIAIVGEEVFGSLDAICEDVCEKLFMEYYVNSEDMPYGAKKSRTVDSHQWIYERLNAIKG